MRKFLLPWSAAALLLFSAGCATAPLGDKRWIEVRTAHFEILSDAGDKETLALAERLETFRAIVQFITHVRIVDPAIPVRLYVFSKSEDYARFGPPDSKGFTLPNTRAYFMAIDSSTLGTETRGMLRHEYTHFLVRNVSHLRNPRWYDEGFAELLSAVELEDDEVSVGGLTDTIRHRLNLPYKLPLERVMKTESFEGMSGVALDAYYGRAWAMVHYAIFDTRSNSTKRHAQLSTYLHLTEEGMNPDEALRRSFGGTFKQLSTLVTRHLSDPKLPYTKVSREALDLELSPELRVLPRAEVATSLAELALEMRSPALTTGFTERSLEDALLLNPDNGRAHALLARILALKSRGVEAQTAFQRALALAPNDPLNHVDYGDFLLRNAFTAQHSPERRREMVGDAREHFLAAYHLNDDLPEPLAQIAKTYLSPGADPREGIPYAEGAYARLPSNTEVNTLLGTVYLKSGLPEKARPAFGRALRSTHSPSEAARIRKIMTREGGR